MGTGTTWDGDRYQRRFDELVASGADVHGEADLVARWGPATVLDAGCGTGRVARQLATRGIDVVGVDADESMIATARRLAPDLAWVVADLAGLELHRRFDLVVMAGNVPLFTPEGTESALVSGCARHLVGGGHLVTGFQLDRGYTLERYDEDCRRSGLELEARGATWAEDPWVEGGSYAVSVHRVPPETIGPTDGSTAGPVPG
jgi:SAM-dependent methyltransferase